MSSRSHDALVARLTEYARKHPRGYRARVAGLALLGYTYLFAALTLLAGLVAVLVFFILKNFGAYIILKAVVPFVVLIWLIGKSLWVRFTPPEGMEVRKADAPRLMEEIKRVRTAMQAPRVHHVLITDDFNASVAQYPRLGVFGWYHVYLMIGLPLLGALPPEEFRAVLAHEFGHVSRAHGRFGALAGSPDRDRFRGLVGHRHRARRGRREGGPSARNAGGGWKSRISADATAGRGPDGACRRPEILGRSAAAGEGTGSAFFRGGRMVAAGAGCLPWRVHAIGEGSSSGIGIARVADVERAAPLREMPGEAGRAGSPRMRLPVADRMERAGGQRSLVDRPLPARGPDPRFLGGA